MIKRLKNKFGVNEPIFTNEILSEMSEYSRPRIFQLMKLAENNKELIKFEKGIYYIPTETRYGKSLISVEQVIRKKYISDKNEIFGIYSGLLLQQNFMLTTQVPTAIEIVTNNETMWVREIKMKNRSIVLKKSRIPITKENVDAYTILELFTNIDTNQYLNSFSAQREVKKFIKDKKIKCKDILTLAGFFPSKTMKNIIGSGIIKEFT